MEMQNIIIFALIGAVCMFIVTGGALSMTSDSPPEPSSLASGAAVGGALGAAASYLMKADIPSVLGSITSLTASSAPDMKVGLPNF